MSPAASSYAFSQSTLLSVLAGHIPLETERHPHRLTACCGRGCFCCGGEENSSLTATGAVLVGGVPRETTAYASTVSLVGQEDTLCDLLTGATGKKGGSKIEGNRRRKKESAGSTSSGRQTQIERRVF